MNKSDVETLKQYVDLLPPYLTRRFISEEQDAVIVSGRVPDSDASQLLPIVDRIDKQLNAVRAKYPTYKIAVTGLSVISARNSALMPIRTQISSVTTPASRSGTSVSSTSPKRRRTIQSKMAIDTSA